MLQVEILTIPVCELSAITVEGFIIIVGGRKYGNKSESSAIRIDLKKLTKENITPMNHGRSYFKLIEMPCYNPDS